MKKKRESVKEKIFYTQIDSLEAEEKKIIRATLNDILPDAFALVKETARRFSEK